MKPQDFLTKVRKYGYFKCDGKTVTGKGRQQLCQGDPRHDCAFILKRVRHKVHKIPPRYTTQEQRIMRDFCGENGEGYLRRHLVTRMRRPPK